MTEPQFAGVLRGLANDPCESDVSISQSLARRIANHIDRLRVQHAEMRDLLTAAADLLTRDHQSEDAQCALSEEITHFLEALDAAKQTP